MCTGILNRVIFYFRVVMGMSSNLKLLILDIVSMIRLPGNLRATIMLARLGIWLLRLIWIISTLRKVIYGLLELFSMKCLQELV